VADTAPRGGKRGSLSRSYAWCIWASFYPLHNHQKVQRPGKLLHLPPTTTSASTNQPFHESFLTAAHCEGPRVRDPRRPEPLTLRCFWNQVEIPHLVLASTAHMKCCSYGLRHMLLADHDLGVLPCTRQSRDRVGGAHIASQKTTPAERQLPRSAAESRSTLVSRLL
jgi:hypothetical protein